MSLEIEAKFRVAGFAALRRRLRDLGAVQAGKVLERNWVLDSASGRLSRRRLLLRVRNRGGGGGILTVKGPAKKGEFKIREEVETRLDSLPDFLRQMEMLGYGVAWRYEKRRESWKWRDCLVELDACPGLGRFVEIEGRPGRIRSVARALGLDPSEHIEDNYLGLWQKHLVSLGQPFRDMVFPGSAPASGQVRGKTRRLGRRIGKN